MTDLPTGYDALPAADKLEALWGAVCAAPYDDAALPTSVPGAWGRRHLFKVGYDEVSFTHGSDVMPAGRSKLIHRYGTCAKVRVDVDDARGFTGFFETGGEGLIRFSDASGGGLFVPSFALKVPVTGAPSLNTFGLPKSRRSPKNPDFLSGGFSNATPGADSGPAKLLGKRFEATVQQLGATRAHAVYLPLHHFAGTHVDGQRVASPVVPDRLEVDPTDEARAAFDPAIDFRLGLALLEPGTRIFDLRVSASIDEDAQPFGSMTLLTRCVATPFGDEQLFFQHDIGPTA